MFTVVPLFSVPLAVTNIGPMDPISLAWLKNLDFPVGEVGRDNKDNDLPADSQGMYLLHKPQMKNLRNAIEKAVQQFVSELAVNTDLEITTSWVNKTSPGDWVANHGHECAMISGVYYPEIDPSAPPIIFNKSYSYTNLFHNTVKPMVDLNKHNQFNMESYTIQPKNGDLLMFPSHLEHEVPPNMTNIDRYSVAFNLFSKGTVGHGQSKHSF